MVSLRDGKSIPPHTETRDRLRLRDLPNENLPERGWRMLYHAKRLLELNEQDREVDELLSQIPAHTLTYVNRDTQREELNPVLKQFSGRQFSKLLRSANLVERETGDLICNQGDSGDTMYLILDGAVGIILPNRIIAVRRGEIVGELVH